MSSDPVSPITEEIPAALHDERLDRVVALMTSFSRSEVASIIAAGGVVLDGVTASAGKVHVRTGQVVEIDVSLRPVAGAPQPDPSVELPVVYDDDDIVVIDKPSGLVVHPAPGHPDGTLVNGVLARYPEVAAVGDPARPGIVHRLDVGTSGLMLVARRQLAFDQLVAALANRDVTRVYDALVWGHPASPSGIIDAPIGRDPREPMKFAVVVGGRAARTRYSVSSTYRVPEVALLRCALETGRTHQIRVHLAAIGHPVVGDAAYGGSRSALACPRPFLHAAHLAFTHPIDGRSMAFDSPLPADLVGVLDRCEREGGPAETSSG